MSEPTKGRVGRPPKSETVQEDRRRRKGSLGQLTGKLDVPQEIRDNNPDFTFRWVSDSGTRINDMTVRDDWDIVDRNGHPATNDPGSAMTRVVGTNDKTGQPVLGYLMRKPLAYHLEDQAAKEKHLKDKEAGIRSGASANVESGYIPGTNTIEFG